MSKVNADPFFENIKCLLDEKGDLEAKVEKQLASLGLAVIFELEKGDVAYPSIGAYVVDLKPSFTIMENVLINRDPQNTGASGKTAADVIDRLFQIFHPLTGRNPIYLLGFELISDAGGVVIYNMPAKAKASWKPVQEE